MRIAGIEFPKELLDALRDGSLVVFAGAGVSMGEPAELPNFKCLADRVARGTGEEPREGELADAFLGRLAEKGVQVHSIAARVLSGDGLDATDLHRSLLRLYPNSESTRIVTTNFDLLFEKASESVFGSQPEVFKAPTLPSGGQFNGIVHVHGSVDRSDEMVLTDADFGRAYLTDGSARRFLVDLFSSFTVLFVGYSHEDMVMKYLARALPERDAELRFVLTHDTGDGNWQLLGIGPLLYDKSPDGSHAALREGVDGLANHARRSVLDWQRKIAGIATDPPSPDQEAMDLIDWCLSEPIYARFFSDAASDSKWIEWLELHGHLDTLFVPADQQLTEQHARLAWWLAKTFLRDQPGVLFLLIQRKGMRLHWRFWWELARAAGSDQQPRLARDVLAQWVSLLLATMPPFPDEHVLLWMGERCADAGLTDNLLDVFDVMIVNRLVLKPGYATPEDDGTPPVMAEFEPTSDGYNAKELWERKLRPRLDQVGEPLLADAVQKFAKQHRLLRSWQSADEDWDAASFRRSAIEPHEQDSNPEAIDVLIDAARDCLQHLAIKRPKVAGHWCDYLVRAEVPLLRRLAVHALSARSDLTADEKIDWLLTNLGLHDRAAHHETFRSMKIIYPDVSPERRETVLEAVFSYESPDRSDGRTELYASYRHFTWLDWLRRSDPKCDLVGQHLHAMRERHPDFESSVHPDLTHFMSVGAGPQSPWTVEDFLSRPAPEWLDDLLRFQDTDSFDSDRDALLRAVSDAAIREFSWGVALADELAGSNHWDSDLWPVLLGAWSREMDEDKHRVVLDRLGNQELYSRHTRSVVDLIYELAKNGGMPYAARLLPEANRLAVALWDCLDANERLFQGEDWLIKAINHPAGRLTEFWVHSLSLWRQEQDPRPRALGDEYSPMFSRIIEDKTVFGKLGKAVFAQHLGFLLAVDEDWTKKHLVPLFAKSGSEAYSPVWHGVLNGDLNAQIANALEGAFLKAVSHMTELFSTELRTVFVGVYTGMAVYSVDDPLDAWIPKFFAHSSQEDKRKLAWNMGNYLRNMDDAKQRDLWERWLRDYWKNRLQGIPGPLTVAEIPSMLSWVPHLKTFFPEAVEYAIQMPKSPFEDTSIVHQLNEGDAWSKYPGATVRLLKYMADCEPPPWVWHEGEELIKKLRGLDLSEELDRQLQELAVRLNLS